MWFLKSLAFFFFTFQLYAQAGNRFESANNVKNEKIASGSEWQGKWQDVSRYNSITVACWASESITYRAEFSIDQQGVVDSTIPYKCPGPPHRLTVARSWMRIVAQNDNAEPAQIRLETMAGDKELISAPLNISLAQDADAIAVRSFPAELDLAQQKLSGFGKAGKLGKNSDIDTGTVPEWITEGGGVYTGFPETADFVIITSDSLFDAPGLTGAHTVEVVGLDENYNTQRETVTLNGITGAQTANKYIRMHTSWVASSASGNTAFNAGTLTYAQLTSPLTVFLKMLPGTNQTNYAVYTVPAGKIGIIKKITAEIRRGTSSGADGSFYVRLKDQAPRYRRPFSVAQTSPYLREPYGGLRFPEKTDLGMVITFVSQNNISVVGGFDIVLIDQ